MRLAIVLLIGFLAGTLWGNLPPPQEAAAKEPTVLYRVTVLPQTTPAPEVKPATDPFFELYQEAMRSGKTLYVWVDYRCPSSALQVGGLHFYAPEKRWRDVTGPAVVILKPRGDGWMGREKVVLAKDCCARELTSGPTAPASRASGGG